MAENILDDLLKGLNEREIPYTVVKDQDADFEVRFPEANDADCLLLVILKSNNLEIHRVMGAGVIKRMFDSPEFSEDFFYLLERDYATVKRTIELRNS